LAASSAIFSPSVARIAASTARDWNYVDNWLSTKFHGRTPPSFERNPETLKALLTLAAFNETADEERDLFARAEATALNELDSAATPSTTGPSGDQELLSGGKPLAECLLDSIEAGLTKEGRTALEVMAGMATHLGIAYPEPEQLGRKVVEIQGKLLAIEQMGQRIGGMETFLKAEAEEAEAILRKLYGDEYKPPTNLAKKNLELQRTTKSMADRLPELRDRLAALSSPSSPSYTYRTVEELEEEEAEYLTILSRKKELESQIAAFQGLPSNLDMAREELEALRSELRNMVRRRDMVFEGLVERESPKKRPR